jgi:glycosyltransferase involved in cell wall biosynthesis
VLVNLACVMIDQGVEVDVVLASATGPFLPDLPADARIIDLKASRIICSILPLARYLREVRPDAVLGFQDHTSVAAIAAAVFSRSRIPIFATVHSSWTKVLEEARHKDRLFASVASLAYHHAAGIITVSHGVAAAVVGCLGVDQSRVQVIYNPVITSDLFSKAEAAAGHPWLRSGERPVILGIGRLHPAKDFATLVASFAQLRSRYPARLMILGEGEERPALEALVKKLGLSEDVALPGFIPNPYPYLRQASAFVLSSAWEGLPTVLIEALALGSPIVSTDCACGPSEILRDGELGTLVPVGDIDAMASAIYEAITTKHAKPDQTSWARFTVPAATATYIDTLFRSNSPHLLH